MTVSGPEPYYVRHGLIVERRLDGNRYYSSAMGIDVDSPQAADALLMRFTKTR